MVIGICIAKGAEKMKTKKKLRIIPITETDGAIRRDRSGMPVSIPSPKSVISRINSVPCRIEYTPDGVKVWTLN